MFIKPPHDQQIFFKSGHQRWVRHVLHIEEGKWTHFYTNDGVEYITNPDQIEFIRVYELGKTKSYGDNQLNK
jgi:hypothetical protein